MRYLQQVVCLAVLNCAVSVQAAETKFEIRRAETTKAEGLIEAKDPDSKEVLYLHKEAVVTSADVASAKVVKMGNHFALALEFKEAGAKRLEKATEAHKEKPLAILIDGKVVSAPLVRSKVSTSAVITGNFTKEELDGIARGLQPR